MLFTIACTLIGIVLALLAAGQGFSVTALMVIGIAVANGILLVDHANRRLLDGLDRVEAIIDATRTRFVPIAMTSLATIIGLLPFQPEPIRRGTARSAAGLEHGAQALEALSGFAALTEERTL